MSLTVDFVKIGKKVRAWTAVGTLTWKRNSMGDVLEFTFMHDYEKSVESNISTLSINAWVVADVELVARKPRCP